MINFFRKMRQQELSENRFRKYVMYATGEIFLVVMGILIALGVNNWNNQRKLKNQAYYFLEEISIDLDNEINTYESDLFYYKKDIKYLEAISKGNYENIDLSDVYKVLTSNILIRNFGLTFSNFEAAGTMNKLPAEVIKKLTNYYKVSYPHYYKFADYNRTFVLNHIEGKLLGSTELLMNRKVNAAAVLEQLKNGQLSSYVNYQCSILKNFKGLSERVILEANNLRTQIDLELKKNENY